MLTQEFDTAKSAGITDLDINPINRFEVILQILASGQYINIQ